MGKWSDAQFMTLLHTGNTPAGKHLDDHKMPWDNYSALDPTKMNAI